MYQRLFTVTKEGRPTQLHTRLSMRAFTLQGVYRHFKHEQLTASE